MAITSGLDGRLNVNGTELGVNSWTYNPTIADGETTNVGDTDQSFKQVTRAGSGNIVINFDATNASLKVICDKFLSTNSTAPVWLVLFTDETNLAYWNFSAIITDISFPKAANDVDKLTVNFKKTGNTYAVPTT